jgi:hypothetical protein
LADPDIISQRPIHLLIGADLYGSLLLGDLRQGPLGTPTAQKIAIGWIIFSPTDHIGLDNADKVQVSLCISKCDTNTLLCKFWEDKEILQKLSLKEEDDWDAAIPQELMQRWLDYVDDLSHLACVRISRWTDQHKESLSSEMHGFADASNRAYVTVLYLRVIRSSTNFQVSLICAKTKVAPVKTISKPRLELNAVVRLS